MLYRGASFGVPRRSKISSLTAGEVESVNRPHIVDAQKLSARDSSQPSDIRV
jgi:hypothetical protein